jgi:hypothetical protein
LFEETHTLMVSSAQKREVVICEKLSASVSFQIICKRQDILREDEAVICLTALHNSQALLLHACSLILNYWRTSKMCIDDMLPRLFLDATALAIQRTFGKKHAMRALLTTTPIMQMQQTMMACKATMIVHANDDGSTNCGPNTPCFRSDASYSKLCAGQCGCCSVLGHSMGDSR